MSHPTKRKRTLKVVLIGDKAVGKTSLCRAYFGETFESQYKFTIGGDFYIRRLEREDEVIVVQIWDLAGQEQFELVRKSYYLGASGIILVFDVTRPDTLANLVNWIQEARECLKGALVPLLIMGNKIDLREVFDKHHYITTKEAKKFVSNLVPRFQKHGQDLPILFVETSAKTGEKVDFAIDLFIELLIQPKSDKSPRISEQSAVASIACT